MKLKSISIKDNGVRCFVPPCFSYDLLDEQSNIIRTVSDVVISNDLVSKQLSPEVIIQNGKLVDGTLQEYEEHLGELKSSGLRFIVTQIHGT